MLLYEVILHDGPFLFSKEIGPSNRELPITRNDTLLVIHEEILKSCRPSKRPFHGVKFPNNRAIYDSQGGFIVRVETAVSRLKFTIVVTRRNHGARCNKTAGNCSLPMLSVPSFSRPQKNSLAGSVSRTPRRRGWWANARLHADLIGTVDEDRREHRSFSLYFANLLFKDEKKKKEKKATTQSRGMKRPFCPFFFFFIHEAPKWRREKLSYIRGRSRGWTKEEVWDFLPPGGRSTFLRETRRHRTAEIASEDGTIGSL